MLSNLKNKLKEKGELYIRVKARPGAAKSEIAGFLDDETVKINIAAPAEKGKANAELVGFLSKEFSVAKNNVKILSGAGDRVKLIRIMR